MTAGRGILAGSQRLLGGDRELARVAAPLALAAAILDGGYGCFLIVIQAFLPDELRAGPPSAGYALAVYGFTRVLLQSPGSLLARRIGAARVVAAGLLGGALALFVLALTQLPWQAYALIFAYGAATACAWPGIFVSAGERSAEQRGALLGMVTFAGLFAGGVGIGIATLLVDHVSSRGLLAAAGTLLAVGAVGVAWLYRESASPAEPVAMESAHHERFAVRERVAPLLVALALQGIGATMILPILREYAHERLGVEMQRIAFLALPAAVALVIALRLAGPATDRFGRAPVAALGSLAAAAGIACLALGTTQITFCVAFVPLAAGYAACAVALNAWITDIAASSAAAVGVTLTVQGIAFAIGPALTGLLLARGGLDWALWGAAIVWAPAALCALWAPGRGAQLDSERPA